MIKHDLFVHVPSGKMRICGQSKLDVALLIISFMVFWRESGSSLQTYTGCVKLIISGKKVQLVFGLVVSQDVRSNFHHAD